MEILPEISLEIYNLESMQLENKLDLTLLMKTDTRQDSIHSLVTLADLRVLIAASSKLWLVHIPAKSESQSSEINAYHLPLQTQLARLPLLPVRQLPISAT